MYGRVGIPQPPSATQSLYSLSVTSVLEMSNVGTVTSRGGSRYQSGSHGSGSIKNRPPSIRTQSTAMRGSDEEGTSRPTSGGARSASICGGMGFGSSPESVALESCVFGIVASSSASSGAVRGVVEQLDNTTHTIETSDPVPRVIPDPLSRFPDRKHFELSRPLHRASPMECRTEATKDCVPICHG